MIRSLFNYMMKSLIFILFSNLALAQLINFDCSNGQCSMTCGPADPTCSLSAFSVNPTPPNCSGYNCSVGDTYSNILSTGVSNFPVNITSDPILKPQNFKININNGAYPGKDLTVNLNAKAPNWNSAGSMVLIGDNFDNLNINLNGYSGENGDSASTICANKIKNGDYGSGVQTFFNDRRASNPAIDPNRCDLQDLNYMQQFSFSCDDPSFSEVSAANPTVDVLKIRERARCSAVGSYSSCVKRKVNVTCGYRLFSTIRNRFMGPNDVSQPTWTGEYAETEICSNQYTLVASAPSNNCDNSINSTQLYPGSSNPCSSGIPFSSQFSSTIQNNKNGYFYRLNGSLNSGTVEAYTYGIVCQQNKKVFVPFERTVPQLGPFDEEFVIRESNRLGGIGGFCQQYGAIPATTDRDWFGGIVNPPHITTVTTCYNQFGNFCVSQNYESSGIPWEEAGSNVLNVNWQSDTTAQHPLITGSRPQTCTAFGGGSYSCPVPVYRSAIWKADPALSSMALTSPGLDSSGLALLPGSNWELLETNTFETCPSDYSLIKNNFITLIQYADNANSCSSVTDPLDPNRRALWQYTGMAQETSFGTQTVSCSIGSCAVNSSVSDLARNLEVITPGSGENGTEQGRGLLFVYDTKNITLNANPGSAGVKGLNDLQVSPQVRICAKIDDASAGINTEQAKNPFVSFRRYQWEAVKSNNGGNNGVPPAQTGKKVELFKKLDPALRNLLDKNLL